MSEHTNSPLLYFWRWLLSVVRPCPWTYGTHGMLKARKHKDGRMEIFAPRSNPEHSLWIETHPDHWHKFKADLKDDVRE